MDKIKNKNVPNEVEFSKKLDSEKSLVKTTRITVISTRKNVTESLTSNSGWKC